MDDLLHDIETFCAAHAMRESRFGRDAVNDAKLVSNLREGRELRRATREKVRHFMVTFGAKEAA